MGKGRQCRQGARAECERPDAPPELYDLLEDPHESRHLTREQPEIVAELLAAHDAWCADRTGHPGKVTGVQLAPFELPADPINLTVRVTSGDVLVPPEHVVLTRVRN
ncbi:MAG: hypothetical protein ACYSU7_07415 [Planctomycetota bacterium]